MGAAPGQRWSAEARRQQIVAGTIETVAAVGYRSATFAQITRRCGLSSTRLISYHFANRDELFGAVVQDVFGRIGAHVEERLTGLDDPSDRLATYVRATVEFIDENRRDMQAVTSIFLALRDEAGRSHTYDSTDDERAIGAVEQILRDGQARGTFGSFDPFVMGTLVQRSVDGLSFLLETRPDLDLPAYAEEVVRTFDLATRPWPPGTVR